MIRPPPGAERAAFSEAGDGDLRNDPAARVEFSRALGIPVDWATVDQVHGTTVRRVAGPGSAGEGDAVWTSQSGVPLAVFTADCFGVVLSSPGAVGVAHAGWRGAHAGVVATLSAAMTASGFRPESALIGPGIGPCCFEVGPEVSEKFPDATATTSWGTTSVDLAGDIRSVLGGLRVWSVSGCTMHDSGWFSHRESGTGERMGTVAWL